MPDAPPSPEFRERLIAALAGCVRKQGLRSTTVADIVARARTSRRTFYEHFADKEACFLALFEERNAASMAAVAGAVDPNSPWDEQVDRAVDAFVDTLATDPELGVSFTRELPVLGAAAATAQRIAVEHFSELIVRLVDSPAMREAGVRPVDSLTALLLVGGLRELVIHTAEHGGDLSAIRPVAKTVVKAVLDPAHSPAA